jgi:uncharacterized protein YcbK (DUF882 family)
VVSRRAVLKLAGLAALLPRPAFAAARPRMTTRVLSLYSIHTGERLTAEYFERGRYQADAMRAISRLLRDHRTGQMHPIDPMLLDGLHGLCRALGARGAVHVVSGYRCEATNAWLRQSGYGVAEHSYHLTGRAVDFFVPGRALRDVRRVAMRATRGGVGYYPASGFVHVDTGPIRTWAGMRS